MALNFPFLDNLEPIAPMDRLHTALGTDSESGHYLNPVYVPKYLNPDAFPTVAGKGCNCSMPTPDNDKIECTCGKNGAEAHYTWLKTVPVSGTNNYTLEPADITYRGGDLGTKDKKRSCGTRGCVAVESLPKPGFSRSCLATACICPRRSNRH